eukprot:6489659-Amphidinium_carterae.2
MSERALGSRWGRFCGISQSYSHPLLRLTAIEVLPDFLGPAGMLANSLRLSSTLAQVTELEDMQLRQLFTNELTKEEVQRMDALRADLGPMSHTTRQSNKSFLRAVDHMLVAGLGKGLLHFKARACLQRLGPGVKRFRHTIRGPAGTDVSRACLLYSDGKTEYEWPRQYLNGAPLEPLLHVFMDQGSIGLPAAVFVCTSERLRMSLNFDWCHRLVNDWSLSLSRSGLHIVRLEYKLATTARFGPWGGAANHWQLKQATEDFFSRNTHKSWIFQIVYDKLCQEDASLTKHPLYGEEAHEEMVFQLCKSELQGSRMEGNAQLARWWNVEHRSRALRSRRWMLVLLLIHLGHHKRWWPKMVDCPLFGRSSRYLDTNGEEEKSMDADGSGTDGARAEAQDGGGVLEDAEGEGPSAGLESCPLGRARQTASQRRAGQILKELAHLLCDDMGVMLWQALSHLCVPLEQAFSRGIKQMKSADGRSDHLRDLVKKVTIERVVSSTLQTFGSIDFARACLPSQPGHSGYTEFQLRQITVGGHHLLQLVLGLCTELHVSGLMYSHPPMQFLRLLDQDPVEVQKCLHEMSDEFACLCKLEDSINTHVDSGDAEQLWRSLLPPHVQWVRETWLRCWESEFAEAPAELVHQLQCFARAHHSTLQVEYGFNECRAQAKKSKTHRQSGAALWNTSMYGHTPADFERPVQRVESSEQNVKQRSLPQGLFTQKCCEMTLPESSLEKLGEKRPSWPDHSPSSIKQAAIAWELLKLKRGNFDEMKEAWLSLLLEPGTLILDVAATSRTARLVTGVSKHGYFWMRPEIGLKDKMVFFSDSEQKLYFDVLSKPENWKVAKLRLRPPTPNVDGHSGFKTGFTLEIVHGKAIKVPQFAAQLGFKHMTCAYLRKLRKYYDLSGSCKNAEHALVSSLVEHLCKGSCDEEVLSQALHARKLTGHEIMLKTSRIIDMGRDTVAEAFVDEQADDDPDLVAMQQWESLSHQKKP